jgi:GNAT superfamily N-acetyltransferase
VVGAFHGVNLVAYATLHAPGVREENLGVDLGLPESELAYVAHLAGSAVDPEYRGNHLQSHLVDVREEFARQSGFRHLCGEVVPGNAISIHNHLAVGYYLKAFRFDHLGEPNFVLDKELQRPPRSLLATRLRERTTLDVAGFREMVEAGRWGFRTMNRPNGANIVFGRFARGA